MSHPKLNLDDLKVESFTTGFGLSAHNAGTVHAYVSENPDVCNPTEIGETCNFLDWTCGAQCGGSNECSMVSCPSSPEMHCTGFSPCTYSPYNSCDDTCMQLGTCEYGPDPSCYQQC
jgi:hypothetical protein